MKALSTFILENRFKERHDSPPQMFKGLSHKKEIIPSQGLPVTELGSETRNQGDRSLLMIKRELCSNWNLPENPRALDLRRIDRLVSVSSLTAPGIRRER